MTIYTGFALAAALLFALAAGMLLHAHFSTRRRILERLLQQHNARMHEAVPLWQRIVNMASATLLQTPLFSAAQRADATRKLTAAGHRGVNAMAALQAITLACAVSAAILASLALWSPANTLHWATRAGGLLIAVWLGTLLPRLVLERLVVRRRRAVVRGLPDALDLMIICTNAGLGLNACLQRVAIEMAPISPAVADEFALTFAEAQLSGDARAAMHRMADRVDIAAVKSLVATLAQAQRYGTPITQALRVLANGERRMRLLTLEEKAGKLGTKITLPMMLFILPPVLMVSAGPAILKLMESFQ